MAGQLGNVPVLILREGTERTRGKDAHSRNITAAKAVAAAVRTTLGPKGMDKMLVDPAGLVTITNDGATILKELDVQHPAAKMIVEVAKTQDDEVGDGTTTAAVLAGEFLKKAEELLELAVHPTVIVQGYQLAAEKSYDILKTIAVTDASDELLAKIAATALTGKGAEAGKDKLSNIVVSAVKSTVEQQNGRKVANVDDILIVKRMGGSIEDSELVHGIVLDKTRTHTSMPERVENPKILLLSAPIEVKKTETKSEISVMTPSMMRSFVNREDDMIKEAVFKVINSGATAVFCQKGVDDTARHYLAKAGIFTAHRVTKKELKNIEKATGAKLVTSLDEIKESAFGSAGAVEEVMMGNGTVIAIRDCPNQHAVCIVLRGGTEQVVNALDRAVHDAIRVVGVLIEDGSFVPGGGAPEVELALRLREFAATLRGREQLAVQKFADALEVIPKSLAENAGLDPIDMLIELRSHHKKGQKSFGLNVYKGKAVDMTGEGVVEPLRVKTQAIKSASEAAAMILRIDDVIAAQKSAQPKKSAADMAADMPE